MTKIIYYFITLKLLNLAILSEKEFLNSSDFNSDDVTMSYLRGPPRGYPVSPVARFVAALSY